MLRELRIRDFAIIDELSLTLGEGLNILSGETGAGKSILIEAVHLLLGGRARTEVIRSGAEEAAVEAIFEPGPKLAGRLARFDLDGGEELLIRRIISRSGKSRISVNGSPMTLALLEEIALGLVDITGQHEHHTLLRPDTHLEILDDYAALEAGRKEVRETFARLGALQEERASLEKAERERSTREDFLAFQLQEISHADLHAGEEEELQLERARLRNAQRLLAAAGGGEEALYAADGAAAAVLARIERELAELGAIDAELGALGERLGAARVEIEDVARSLGLYARGLSADPGRLSEIEDRLALVGRLKRKHGGSVEEVIAAGSRIRGELDALAGSAERLEAIGGEIAAVEEALRIACQKLSADRKEAARRLEKGIEKELGTLALGGSRFRIEIAPRPGGEDTLTVLGARVGPKGIDRVEFLFSPNRGEDEKPLVRIASGGELSRVTLALKNVLVGADPVGTYVFDEVDAGVGGPVGEVLGRKLKQVSSRRQVICITHLPQIAAFADRHFRVAKKVSGGRTVCTVKALSESERMEEVARMLGGMKVTDKTKAHAEEMIRAAR
jgi:DNA repair protein RecN (Recombination protein N)